MTGVTQTYLDVVYLQILWYRHTKVLCTLKRLMGWNLRLQIFPAMLYIAITLLTRRIHIYITFALCAILDEFCYIFEALFLN